MRRLRPGVRIANGTVQVYEREAVARVIALQDAAGEGFRAPLLRAAGASALVLATAVGGTRISARVLKLQRPTVVLLADDQPAATGPDAWPQARRLARWARMVALHATGGQPEHYALFAQAAVLHERLLVVELEYCHLAAWRDLMLRERRPSEILCLVPTPGGQHPVPPSQSGGTVH